MPLNAYFKGNGNKVMKNMMNEYGPKKGESVFYATANKTGMKPPKSTAPAAGMAELGRPRLKRKLA